MARKNKKSGTSSGEGDAISVKQVKKSKKRRGDRRDGRLVREADSMHKLRTVRKGLSYESQSEPYRTYGYRISYGKT